MFKRDHDEAPHQSLKAVPGLTDDDVAAVWARGTVVTVPAGWSMIHEHQPPDTAYLILEGRTRVVRTVGDSLGGYLPDMFDAVIAEHEKIVAAFERRDPAAAGKAVFDHVTAARDRLLTRMAGRQAFADGSGSASPLSASAG